MGMWGYGKVGVWARRASGGMGKTGKFWEVGLMMHNKQEEQICSSVCTLT
jgi:hypothetical protein